MDWNSLRNYTTLKYTYRLLYCKGHIQITSNHSIINMKKRNRVNKKTLDWNTLRNYTTLKYTYLLLHCKGHGSDHKESQHHKYEKKSNRVNKVENIGLKYT